MQKDVRECRERRSRRTPLKVLRVSLTLSRPFPACRDFVNRPPPPLEVHERVGPCITPTVPVERESGGPLVMETIANETQALHRFRA